MRSLCRQLLVSSFAAAIVSSTVHAAEPFYTDKAFLASIHPNARAQFVALNNTSAPQLSHSNLPLVPSSAAVKTNTKDKAAAMVLPPLAKDELAANKQTPLTSIEFKDEVLKQCILTQAAAMHQVIYAEQMRNIWCTGVTDLTGIENFINLEIIELIGSPWEDKVLSDLSKLATFTALRRLDLSSNRLTDAQFATLKGAMFQQQDQDMMLRVYNNALTAASIPLIKELITSTAPVKYLDVTQNNFKTLQGIETLSDITQLHIGSNPFADVVSEVNRFRNLPALNELFINDLAIDDTVASKLQFAPMVTRLLLDFNPLTHLDHILAKLNLENLELISLYGAQSLRDASALVNATNLKILAMAYTPLRALHFWKSLIS
ncbi:hypothetical protein [Alishewanella longhuensis]